MLGTYKKPTILDAWTQFIIGPFHSTLELLFMLGFKPDLKIKLEQASKINLKDFENGVPLYKK